MRKLCSLFVLIVTASWVNAQPVNTFLIDDFNNTNGTAADGVLNGQGVWSGYGTTIPNVLGGSRVLGNYLTEGPNGAGNATNISFGLFSIENPPVTRSSGQIIWQGSTATPSPNPIISHPASGGFNLGNKDFNTIVSDPNFYFQWSVFNADGKQWNYTIRAYTNDASNYFEGTLTSNASGSLLSINRSAFVIAAGLPSWGDIDAISFSANYTYGGSPSDLGGDLAIDFMQISVPEMSTYMMIGLSFLLAGSIYARRYGSKAEVKPAEATEGEVAVTTPVAEVPVLA